MNSILTTETTIFLFPMIFFLAKSWTQGTLMLLKYLYRIYIDLSDRSKINLSCESNDLL